MPYSGSIFLTTVYPTLPTGVHGNSGDKSAGKDVFPSGKGRKRPEISGNRYSGILWEQDAAGSSPVTSTIFLSNRIVMRFVFLLTVF